MMKEYLTAEFWGSAATHVALAPGQNAPGLREFMEEQSGVPGWCLFQTSGTEGPPKWAALSKDGLQTSARAVNAHYGVTREDCWLLALPLWHVGGFGIAARAFAAGNRVWQLPGKWDAVTFASMVAETNATMTSLVPAQLFDLVAARIVAPKSLRVVLIGGAALSAAVEAEALKLGWPVRKTYGMTETASQVASQPLHGGELEILPIWDVSTDAEGVLTVKGTALAKGYAKPDGDGWHWEPISTQEGLKTRDRVRLAEFAGRRHLIFEGRESGMVKILGELVALRPIQERLDALRIGFGLTSGDAVICDLPDDRSESRLVLVVSGMSQTDAARLQKEINVHQRPFEQLKQIVPLSCIPRGPLGKIRAEDLRQLVTKT